MVFTDDDSLFISFSQTPTNLSDVVVLNGVALQPNYTSPLAVFRYHRTTSSYSHFLVDFLPDFSLSDQIEQESF